MSDDEFVKSGLLAAIKTASNLEKRIAELERENAALREDKERLDWVIKDSYYHFYCKLSNDLEKGRRQIDAARKEAQP